MRITMARAVPVFSGLKELQMALRSYVIAALAAVGVAASLPSLAQVAASPQPVSATVPALPGWHNGRPVVYLATDASDRGAANLFGANYVPQLANVLTSNAKSYDDIYVVTNFTQANIIPSAPQPLGRRTATKLTRRCGRFPTSPGSMA